MIFQSLEELESDLRSNGFRPVYVILGPERYHCQMALSLLKRKALSPESMAFDYSEFSGAEASIAEIVEAASTFPMLSKRRLVLVTDVDKMEDSAQDALLESPKDLSPRSMLILLAENLDHRKRFYKTLCDRNCVAEFPKLKGAALERWVSEFVRKEGYRLSSGAIRQLIDLAGSDLQSLATELEKLFLYAGEEKNIPDSAVREIVQGSRQQGIFDLIGAIGRRDRSGALKSLANLWDAGEPSLVIVTMMARHCRQVLIAKEGFLHGSDAQEIGRTAQIPPYFLEQFLRQARAADGATIQQMFLHLAEIDRRLKSSAGDGRLLLEKLICALV